jgi:mRNA-degrading endonuclease YafQ of YafQ-DinJ toxin-antitoxin module
VKRELLPSAAFMRMSRRLSKKRQGDAEDLLAAMELMTEDIFHPALRTHKLKGKLARSWACSAGYDLRIVFQLVSHNRHEAILLEAVGMHDEVY